MNSYLKNTLLILLILSFAGCGSLVHYKVQEGDTLYSIGWRYDQDAKKIAEWNGLRAPYVIHRGQVLRIAPPAGTPAEPLFQAIQPEPGRTKRSPTAVVTQPQPKPSTSRVSTGPVVWGWPAGGKLISTFSAKKIDRKGLNISGNKGEPIRAAASGKVVYSGSGLTSYGNLLIIKHSESYLSAYAHNEKLLVKEGTSVKRGEKVATMGATASNQVMLHFEVRYKGKPVDPQKHLPKR